MKQVRIVPSDRRTGMTRVVDVMKKLRLQRLRDSWMNWKEDEEGKEATREKLRKVGVKIDQKGRMVLRQKEKETKRLHEFGQQLLESLRPIPEPVTV